MELCRCLYLLGQVIPYCGNYTNGACGTDRLAATVAALGIRDAVADECEDGWAVLMTRDEQLVAVAQVLREAGYETPDPLEPSPLSQRSPRRPRKPRAPRERSPRQ